MQTAVGYYSGERAAGLLLDEARRRLQAIPEAVREGLSAPVVAWLRRHSPDTDDLENPLPEDDESGSDSESSPRSHASFSEWRRGFYRLVDDEQPSDPESPRWSAWDQELIRSVVRDSAMPTSRANRTAGHHPLLRDVPAAGIPSVDVVRSCPPDLRRTLRRTTPRAYPGVARGPPQRWKSDVPPRSVTILDRRLLGRSPVAPRGRGARGPRICAHPAQGKG